jgi:hypothetical protein
LLACSLLSAVKAVSVVSSFAAIGDFSKSPQEQADRVYTEDDWLPTTAKEMEALSAYVPVAVIMKWR